MTDQQTSAATRGSLLRWEARLVSCEKLVSVLLLVAVVVTLAAQVVARYVFRAPISWSEEAARLALIWLTFAASGFVTAERSQITVDLLPHSLSDRSQRMVDRLAGGLVLTTCLLLLIGGLRFVWRVWPVGSPATGISMSLWYGAASFGLALMSFHAAVQLFAADGEHHHDVSRSEPKTPGDSGSAHIQNSAENQA